MSSTFIRPALSRIEGQLPLRPRALDVVKFNVFHNVEAVYEGNYLDVVHNGLSWTC